MSRIALLITSLARGGAEMQVAQLAPVLSRRGWEVSIISLLPPSDLGVELSGLGIPVFSLEMHEGKASLGALIRLVQNLRKVKPEILHAHLFHANLIARCIRFICPIPVVISTVHSIAESSRKSRSARLRDWCYRVTDWLSDVTVCVSHAAARRHAEAHAISPRRLRVIPNGIDTVRFQPDAAKRARMRDILGLGDAFAWLAVGRLMWKKDYATMLEAMADQREGVLLIAGDGPLEPELQARARQLGTDVRFLGPRADIPELMNACDGLLLSSVVEGLPIVLLEAAACGLPCIATAVGGVSEVVVHARTGFVVPPSDPAAMAAAMRDLRELPPAARMEMSRAARELALTRFDLNDVAAQWDQLYAALLESVRLANKELPVTH